MNHRPRGVTTDFCGTTSYTKTQNLTETPLHVPLHPRYNPATYGDVPCPRNHSTCADYLNPSRVLLAWANRRSLGPGSVYAQGHGFFLSVSVHLCFGPCSVALLIVCLICALSDQQTNGVFDVHDVLAPIFRQKGRDYYNLEALWNKNRTENDHKIHATNPE